jgi:DNA-binding Xre family transcriptional regulator
MQPKELTNRIGITVQNLSILKKRHSKGFTPRNTHRYLQCLPGGVIEFQDKISF